MSETEDIYGLDREFPNSPDDLTNSEVPINPFVIWDQLHYNNEVTQLNDEALGNNRSSSAGIEIDVHLEIPFSLYMVSGKNSEGHLVCWIFMHHELALTFATEDIEDAAVWEMSDVIMQESREKGSLPAWKRIL